MSFFIGWHNFLCKWFYAAGKWFYAAGKWLYAAGKWFMQLAVGATYIFIVFLKEKMLYFVLVH